MRIVAALDGGEEAEAVLPHVERIARESGSEVVLLSVLDPLVDAAEVVAESRAEAMREIIEARRAYLAGCAERLSSIPVSIIIEELQHGEDVPEGIARVCREHGADMLVLASRQAAGVRAFILGSAAQSLLGIAPCPVLVVRTD